MSDFIWTLIGIVVSFLLGNVVLLFMLRGFVLPYLKAKSKGGVLLRIHRSGENNAIWRVATKDPSGVYKYKIGKQEHVFTPVNDSILRSVRVSMADVREEDTAPFVFKKVVAINKEVENVKGEKEVVTQYRLFEGYDDSPQIINMFNWALLRPKKGGSAFGMDTKTLLILLGAIGLIIYVVMSMSSGGSII